MWRCVIWREHMEQHLFFNLYILIEKDKQPKVNKYKGNGIFTALACLFSPFQRRTSTAILRLTSCLLPYKQQTRSDTELNLILSKWQKWPLLSFTMTPAILYHAVYVTHTHTPLWILSNYSYFVTPTLRNTVRCSTNYTRQGSSRDISAEGI